MYKLTIRYWYNSGLSRELDGYCLETKSLRIYRYATRVVRARAKPRPRLDHAHHTAGLQACACGHGDERRDDLLSLAHCG